MLFQDITHFDSILFNSIQDSPDCVSNYVSLFAVNMVCERDKNGQYDSNTSV